VNEPLSVAVVGAGHLGSFHARALARLRPGQPAWVVDALPARARALAEETGAQATTELPRALERVGSVIVATPTESHFEVASAALAAGCHVLLEKPITTTEAEGEALVARARAAGRALQVGHVERFNPIWRALQDELGTPAFAEAERLAPFVPRSLDVDVVLDLMIHDLDLILAVVPFELEAVDAVGVAVLTEREDIANARLRFANGTVANLTASRVSQEKSRKVRCFGPRGYHSIDLLARRARRVRMQADPGGALEVPGLGRFAIHEDRLERPAPDPLSEEIRSFLEAAETGATPAVSGEAALRVLRAAHRVREQVRLSLQRLGGGGRGPMPAAHGDRACGGRAC
jgi:predicted dehydrogenase